MKACCRKSKGFMYIPKDRLHEGYKNGRIFDKSCFILGATDPGFYCSWDDILYLTKSKKIFRVNTPLSLIYLQDHVYVTGEGEPVIFSCLLMENLYSEVFS